MRYVDATINVTLQEAVTGNKLITYGKKTK